MSCSIAPKGDCILNPIELNAPQASVYRREAGAALSHSGNRLTMILAVLVVLFAIVPYILFGMLYSVIVPYLPIPGEWSAEPVLLALDAVYLVCILLLIWLFVLPLFYGLFYMGFAIAREDDVVLADVFHSFSNRANYRRSLALSFSTLWRASIALAVVYLTYYAFIYASGGNPLILLIGAPILLIEIVLALVLSAGGFYTAFFVYDEGVSVRVARKRSKALTRMCRKGAYSYVIDYLLWLLLCFATAGIFLIVDTLPRMLISYFRFCRAINERFNQSEEIKDHE